MRGAARRRRSGIGVVVLLVALCLAVWYATDDALAPLGLAVLWAVWSFLPTGEAPPVLALALTFQWLQVTLGVYYHGLTGRPLLSVDQSDYRPMVFIGLGCVVALGIGLALGNRWLSRSLSARRGPRVDLPVTFRTLAVAYVVTTAANGAVRQAAWLVPGLTQGILAMSFLRLGLLFLLFRRLCRPVFQTKWIALLLGVEVVFGFTGFFAGFREPLMMAALAFIEIFDRRRSRHWLAAAALATVMAASGVLWMGIRTAYRQDFEIDGFADSSPSRLSRVGSLSSEWLGQDLDGVLADVDLLVERVWAVYYPALALQRVPAVLPHEDGAILLAAVRHLVTPRLFFPEKAPLLSDSEMVRKYSGLWVAGEEEGTSIAFGYAVESYVDFGLPWMFLPVLAYGLLMGMAYPALLHVIRHRDLATALVAVVFWLSLFLFERSWVKTLGLSVTLLVFLGSLAFVLDRILLRRRPTYGKAPIGSRRDLATGARRS